MMALLIALATPSDMQVIARFEAAIEGDLAHDAADEDLLAASTRWTLGVETRLSAATLMHLEGALRSAGRTPSPGEWRGLAPARGRAEATAELGEAWLSHRRGPLRLDVGQLIVRWGVMDLQSPNDVLNPMDFRDGPPRAGATDVPVRPIPMLRASHVSDDLSLELVWQPFFVPHWGSATDSDWAATRLDPSLAGALSLTDLLVAPSASEALQPLLLTPDPPEAWPSNGSVAARVGTSGEGLDLHAQVSWAWDRTPTLRVDPELTALLVAAREDDLPTLLRLYPRVAPRLADGGRAVEARHERTLTAGVDAAMAVDAYVVKAEVAATPGRTLYDAALQPVRAPALSWAVGVDWLDDEALSATLELSGLTPLRDGEYLIFGRGWAQAAGVAQWRPPQVEGVEVTLALQHALTARAWAASPTVAWSPPRASADALRHTLAAGLLLLDGEAGTLMGAFGHNDAAHLRYTLSL